MKQVLSTILIFSLWIPATAQVGVGTSTPHTSAALEINASNKGVLMPRVPLQSSTDATTVATPATGLLIYNTNTSLSTSTGSGTGYYYNAGTTITPSWTRLATGSITVAKYIGPASPANVVALGDFEFRYNGTGTNNYLQIRCTSAPSISANLMIVESWATTGYNVNSTDNATITSTFSNVGSTFGQTGEINTFYLNVPSKNEVYRITMNLFGGPIEMLLVEKF